MIYATVTTLRGTSALIRTKDYRTRDNAEKFGLRPAINRLVKGEDEEGEPLRLPGPYLVQWYEDGKRMDCETRD